MLAKYVPAEKLQIEFLNKWRNTEKYGNEPFAPKHYSFEYLFATAMAGQPLAWMEASNLPDEAFSVKALIDRYKEVQYDFHQGVILPIGEEPSDALGQDFSLSATIKAAICLFTERITDRIKAG